MGAKVKPLSLIPKGGERKTASHSAVGNAGDSKHCLWETSEPQESAEEPERTGTSSVDPQSWSPVCRDGGTS